MSTPVKKIRIIGKDYTLHPVSGKIYENARFGQVDHWKQEILYSSDAHEQQVRDTVLHECFHAIEYAVQCDLNEEQVSALSSGLYAWMTENKALVRWIIGD